MNDLAKLLKDDGPQKGMAYRRPRDAATLILIDRSDAVPRVLLGRRHHQLAFMPGKFVFPGGRTEAVDRAAPFASSLDAHMEAKLISETARANAAKARALVLAAIRETYEETGLLLGTRGARAPADGSKRSPVLAKSPWQAFRDAGVLPDLSALSFVARAVTPPGRPRRFDTRFFTADADTIAHRIDGMVGENSELVELVWVPIAETQHLDLPGITRQVLRELEARIAAGLAHDLPVPFFFTRYGKLSRKLL